MNNYKKIIEGLNIPIIETDGFEADDVIGTLAKQAEKEGNIKDGNRFTKICSISI